MLIRPRAVKWRSVSLCTFNNVYETYVKTETNVLNVSEIKRNYKQNKKYNVPLVRSEESADLLNFILSS